LQYCNLRKRCLDVLADLNAIYIRQLDIQQNKVWRRRRHLIDGCASEPGFGYFVTATGEDMCLDVSTRIVIVHHKDRDCLCGHATRPSALAKAVVIASVSAGAERSDFEMIFDA